MPSRSEDRRRYAAWIFFAVLAAAIVVSDQLLKVWIVDHFELNRLYPVVGDWLRIDYIHNAGGLFGVVQGAAPLLAVISFFVIVLLAAMEIRWGWRSWLTTLALSLLLGGAVGNLIDRIQFGYVRDFADIGVGGWRWYVFNIADMAVTCFFLTLLVIWAVAPRLLFGGDSKEGGKSPGSAADGASEGGEGPAA
jgi:signal peptidase II